MSQWQPISTAPREPGSEILGTKFQWDGERMVMVREPFVSAWSDKTGKFIANPTHWVPCPDVPFVTAEDQRRGTKKGA